MARMKYWDASSQTWKYADACSGGGSCSDETSFDKHYAGSLVYISEEGSLIPLLLGSGLKIIDGVISLNIASGSTDKIIEAFVDYDGIFRVYNAGSEVIPEVDENGKISWPGVTVSVDSDGTLTFGV